MIKTTLNVIPRFFQKDSQPIKASRDRYLAELERNLGNAASAIVYLGALREYRHGVHAHDSTLSLLHELTKERELVQSFESEAAFEHWWTHGREWGSEGKAPFDEDEGA